METVAWDFLLLQVESSVLPLAISEHPLVKPATIKVIKQKQEIVSHMYFSSEVT